MKEKLIPFMKKMGYEVVDCGDYKYDENDDFPIFISKVAEAVAHDPLNNKGIILGGSGQGEAIIANRYPNIRAIVYYGEPGIIKSLKIIKLGREHNDSIILSFGARFLKISQAKKALKIWLNTPFSGNPKYTRRNKEIETLTKNIKHNMDF